MAEMMGLLLVAYYFSAFLLEEDLFHVLRQGGLRIVWTRSKLLSTEFALFYYPVLVYVWGMWLPTAGEELWHACKRDYGCRAYLRRSGWSWASGDPRYSLVDLADIQWREFRGALPLLVAAAAGLAALVRAACWATAGRRSGGTVPGALVRLVVGLGFVVYVHGAGSAFPMVLVLLFYMVVRTTSGTRAAVPALWTLALLAIVAKEPKWPVRRHLTFGTLAGRSWAWLDGPAYQGEYDWAQSVNLILLRLLSFSLDCHSAALRKAAGGDQKLATAVEGNERDHAVPAGCRYIFLHGLSHAFYAPAVLAGPTIGFDDYIEQCATPRASNTHLGWYVAQVMVALAALEVGTHAYPCFALARSGQVGQLGPRLGAAAVFLTLNFMWLKFLLLWRIARAWALAEGIDIPENMKRALSNHYSVVGFWRCWHASFNRWLVRYIYIPAGGRDRKAFAAAVTFAFVAIWHDAEAKLMAWGALNAVFLALETLVTAAWQRRTSQFANQRPWLHRQVSALGGVTYIIVLMAVNTIGYSAGISGVSGLLETAASTRKEALSVLLGACIFLFASVQVMLEIRKLDGTWAAKTKSPAVSPTLAPTPSGGGKKKP
eukprot:CAMPEP_0171158790 /NCGR_PEP_ID=MMETSP0790-20130122/2695_1 /TAXON_ID=2925 /ORGANISM="Alexandrium catenella, Strain OF101" /LENGTH=600 /DNA_ID=CAMNT_0011623247 /DNA_START=35 /DNA_END=1837 /DNA_ORIENTATION=-